MSGGPFSVASLAEYWGCSAETVRRRIARGELKAFRIGTLLRVSAQAVEDYECAGGSKVGGSQSTPKVSSVSLKRKPMTDESVAAVLRLRRLTSGSRAQKHLTLLPNSKDDNREKP